MEKDGFLKPSSGFRAIFFPQVAQLRPRKIILTSGQVSLHNKERVVVYNDFDLQFKPAF